MVPDAALPGSDQWPWSTNPATGPAGQLGLPSASDPGGVVRCALSLCRPRCVRVCGVLGHLAPVHRCARPLCSVRGVGAHLALVHQCARCVRCLCVSGCFVGDPPPPFFFARVFFLCLVPSSFCLCSEFSFLCFLVFAYPRLVFLKKEKIKLKRGRVHTAGTGMGIRCSGAAVLRSWSWCASSALCRRSCPRGAARAS